MKYIRYIQASWVALLAVIVLVASFLTPAAAANRVVQHPAQRAQASAATSINATIYLTTASLESQFQSGISAKIPATFNAAITTMVSKLPKKDQSWAYLMATTLLQPSATLVSFIPQAGGLAMTLRLNLYPGDPQPITARSLVTFRVLNSSTAQVNATPFAGSPPLISGQLSTFQVPLGSLNKATVPSNCGAAGLALNLQVPVSLAQGQGSPQVQRANIDAPAHGNPMVSTLGAQPRNANSVNTFIEIPASSLAALGSTVGSIPAGNGITAQNIRISVQRPNLLITSDIYWSGLNIGTAVTTVAPSASGGKMVTHVLSTVLNLFGLFPFSVNSYDAQIEQTLNSKLGNAFSGKFYVAQAAIGPNSQLTCAASDSLLLSGSSTLG